MNDREEEFAWGRVLEVEERSPAWARVRLDDGRCLTAVDPEFSGRRDASLPGGMRPGDRVCVLVDEGYCLIAENPSLSSRRDGPGPLLSP
jgi:hypothetical protein